jgi:hypothetical protein
MPQPAAIGWSAAAAAQVLRFKDPASVWGGFADEAATEAFEAWLANVSHRLRHLPCQRFRKPRQTPSPGS